MRNVHVFSVEMGKFHVNYSGKIDIIASEQNVKKFGFVSERGGGRPEKSGATPSTESQFRFELKDLKAVIQVGPNVVQVYFASYEKLNKIESKLSKVIVPLPGERISFDVKSRKEVETIASFRKHRETWKDYMRGKNERLQYLEERRKKKSLLHYQGGRKVEDRIED